MLDIQQKRKIRSIAYHRITLVVIFLIVLFSIHSTWTVYKKKNLSEEMKQTASNRFNELEVRDKDLQEKIDRLSTEIGVEEEIRTKFSVAKDKESMVVIVDEEEPEASTVSVKTGFWEKIKDLLSI